MAEKPSNTPPEVCLPWLKQPGKLVSKEMLAQYQELLRQGEEYRDLSDRFAARAAAPIVLQLMVSSH